MLAWLSNLAPSLAGNTAQASLSGAENPVASGIGQLWNDVSGTTAQMEWQSSEAQKARDFSERMSNTAYQRAVADLESAGLNPAGAVGNPASTPAAATAQGVSSGSGGFFGLAMNVASRLAGVALGTRLARSIYASSGSASSAVRNANILLDPKNQVGVHGEKPGGSSRMIPNAEQMRILQTRWVD